MKKIYIRCDGGSEKEFGTGHISRMLTLSRLIKSNIKNIEINFLLRKNKNFKIGFKLVKNSKFSIYKCRDKNLIPNSQKERMIFKSLSPDLLIIDRLHLSEKTSKFLVQSKLKFVIFDSKKNRYIKKNQIFNSFINSLSEKDKEFSSIIFNPKIKKKVKSKDNKNLFVCFGGIDKQKYSYKIIKNYKLFEFFKKVHIVTRQKKVFLKIKNFIKKNKISSKFKIYNDPLNFYEILAGCKFSITAGGLTFFDSVVSGLDTIPIPQYKHQLKNIDYFRKTKLIPIRYSKKFKFKKNELSRLINFLTIKKNFKNQRMYSKKYFNDISNKKLIKQIKFFLNEK